MTQFKAKAEKQRDAASLGLLSYPVLMAADILLYQATHVPVGDDQLQHLELTRDIAHAVNAKNPTSHVFTIPTVVYSAATRVMSLRDGRAKMSKSDESDQSRINLLDDADTIRKKIRRAKTDSQTELSYDEESRPEVANLLRIFAELRAAETGAPVSVGTIVDEYRSRGNAAFKDALADVVVASVDPVRSEYLRWMADRSAVSQVLDEGARRAREHATLTMERVKSLVGFQ
jgi:tryptophanyl-tRNA synthetase